jgi:uncharacterized membrane protein YdjX (TVP38/TMEM64 family)
LKLIKNNKFKLAFRLTWIFIIFIALIHYCISPQYYTADFLKNKLENNHSIVFGAYLIISLIRSLFFLPSTIFVIMGVALYPNDPYLVLLISMIGIISGACWIYFAADILKIEQVLSIKSQRKIKKTEASINKHGFWIVLFWSFFPVVPTDLICYISGYSKMNFSKFIVALFIGEIILVSLYIWTGSTLFELVF